MNLPVIAVCGLCTFCGKESDDGYACEHALRGNFVGVVDPTLPPPAWCPLRTPMAPTAEVEKLFRRWVVAARDAARAARTFETDGRTNRDYVALRVAEINEDDALRAMRSAIASVEP